MCGASPLLSAHFLPSLRYLFSEEMYITKLDITRMQLNNIRIYTPHICQL